jgi:hypothetical protein
MQLASAETVWFGAHVVTVGFVTSLTVKVVVVVAVLPAASATVSVIVCAPRVSDEPAAGDWVTDVTAQLSVALTPPTKLGTIAAHDASALAL